MYVDNKQCVVGLACGLFNNMDNGIGVCACVYVCMYCTYVCRGVCSCVYVAMCCRRRASAEHWSLK